MALQVLADVIALIWQHPFLSSLILILFTPPFFPIVKFFSPLLISTALFMLALFTVGQKSSDDTQNESDENWEFRRTADVKVWEDKNFFDSERTPSQRVTDGSWMDWVSSIQELGLNWLESKLKNETWKGRSLNDDNVSILQETTWVDNGPSTSEPDQSGVTEVATPSSFVRGDIVTNGRVPAAIAPSALFKVDSGLKAARFGMDFDEGHPEHASTVGPGAGAGKAQSVRHSSSHSSNTVQHEPLESLQVPKEIEVAFVPDSPATDLDDSPELDKNRRLLFATVRKDSMNANSGLSATCGESDVDTPVPVVLLSSSGKLKQIEDLGDLMESIENAEHTGEKMPESTILVPTTAEQVQDVKDKLEGFVSENSESSSHGGRREERNLPVSTEKKQSLLHPMMKSPSKPGSPLFKDSDQKSTKTKGSISDDSSSSGEEELSDSDDSVGDSEFEIFPPVDPAKMKLHPPVKLDIPHLEKKLGTSLSQRTRSSSPKGEITEIQ